MDRTVTLPNKQRGPGEVAIGSEINLDSHIDQQVMIAVEAADDQWSVDVDDIAVSLEASEDGTRWKFIIGTTDGKGGPPLREADRTVEEIARVERRTHMTIDAAFLRSHFPKATSVRLRVRLQTNKTFTCGVVVETG